MKAEPILNKISAAMLAVAESHSLACWAALERHVVKATVTLNQAGPKGWCRCGCYKHEQSGHIVIHKSCDVGEACAEEYEIASRRVRDLTYSTEKLEFGDWEPGDLDVGEVCAHEWHYTGSAYGGQDAGEGRCYCTNCGADGDA